MAPLPPDFWTKPQPGADVTADELVAFAEVELADFNVPRKYFFRTELPLGKTGKIDKNVLKRDQQ